MKDILILSILTLNSVVGFGQRSDKLPRYFSDPMISDSSSTLMIPTRYNSDLLSSSKIALWNDYYANIIFYDFNADSSKRLFTDDTFIRGFDNQYYTYNRIGGMNKIENISGNWIFYFVKPVDFDKNGRIDNNDPSILFVSDKKGNNLKAITPDNENALSIEIFDNQGFALIKMQRDFDNDNDFESNDKDFYFMRINLDNLSLGHKIEIR